MHVLQPVTKPKLVKFTSSPLPSSLRRPAPKVTGDPHTDAPCTDTATHRGSSAGSTALSTVAPATASVSRTTSEAPRAPTATASVRPRTVSFEEKVANYLDSARPPSRCLPYASALCLLPYAYCLMPDASELGRGLRCRHCLMPTALCLLPYAYCLMPIALCPLP